MATKNLPTKRQYYSQRTGKKKAEMDLAALRKIFLSIYGEFSDRAYFEEYLGDYCPDNSENSGKVGSVTAYILRKLRKDDLWPIRENGEHYTEEDIFDLIEFLFDHVSAGVGESTYHSFYNHDHYVHFDQVKGREEFREEINEILSDYGPGYELGSNGEIYALLEEEFRPLLGASVPASDQSIEPKIARAVNKFRRYGSTLEDRREAVRDLADCLEFLRTDLKNIVTQKDDGDLFNIANNFGIRHHNDKQKTNYENAIWLSWMFYFYLATIHAGLRLMEKQKAKKK